ncbi:MAG: hypothetical protein OSB69_04590, partial [Alphaproteobacteria bacterium]|nr:hypothetical protein [Alphaproteobacteria bacterium]
FAQNPMALLPQLVGYSVFRMAPGNRYDVNPKLSTGNSNSTKRESPSIMAGQPDGYLDRAK